MLGGTSEGAIGKKVSQVFGRHFSSLFQGNQLAKAFPRAGAGSGEEARQAEAAVGSKGGVEVVMQVFAGEVADGADAVERDAKFFGCASSSGGFHFYDAGAFGAEVPFF